MQPTLIVSKIMSKLMFWRELTIQRNELYRISNHVLDDIGVSRKDALHEAKRHFWDHLPI